MGYWHTEEYDKKGRIVRYHNSHNEWYKRTYDDKGHEIYCEYSNDGVLPVE